MSIRKVFFAVLLTVAVVQGAHALEPMPEPGWSGFVNLGVGAGSVESNFLANLSGVDVSLGDDRIDDFGSPDGEDVTLPITNLSIGYTFKSGKTRIFVGNDLADFVQFDQTTLIALRHDMDGIGRLQLSGLATAGVQTEVWEDPYLLGAKRGETERQTVGGRITWDKILGSEFELQVTSRKRDLDEERSGESLGLGPAERALLDREGNVNRAELGYLWDLGNGHFLRPRIAWQDFDLDGDAMARDGYELGVSYLYNSNRLSLVTNLFYQQLDGDEINPIFNEVNDTDRFFASAQAFFPGTFGWKKWMPAVLVAWGDEDSDIDFNDSQVWMVSASLFRRF